MLYAVCFPCMYFTYSNDIKSVVAHFSDLSVFVMHQVYQVGWSLWREG